MRVLSCKPPAALRSVEQFPVQLYTSAGVQDVRGRKKMHFTVGNKANTTENTTQSWHFHTSNLHTCGA
jgi:hypothetical protein